ncbi:unnamed protein product [Brachionus calyciflorus]|uniref:Uncharacterized protein n=1 Tax=Brachionus calyciflorus TaxID=104777 RepID=A0A814MXN5_9BILA|nr:unnamed protein product [Brachionus calyciflorus]
MKEYSINLNSESREIQLGNETWFKILAIISFICALIVNSILVWFLICRQSRIQYTDLEIKQEALNNYKTPFKKRLQRVIFGSNNKKNIKKLDAENQNLI